MGKKLWTRDEVIIAMGLYLSLPFGQMHSRNPRIVEVAKLLGRTPSSLAMKLTNLASLDPAHRARGVRGLPGRSALDSQVWQEFQERWTEMAELSEAKRTALETTSRKTEAEAVLTVRTMQGFFRRIVLAAHVGRCCVTGNPVPELLVASHILPWAEYPEQRLNPRNGLCLAAHYDRAFDRGLISFDSDLRLLVGKQLRAHAKNPAVGREFVERAGQRMLEVERFGPEPDFLAVHRARFGFA